MGLEMDGAMQQAAQPGRQFMGNQFMAYVDYDCIAREMICRGVYLARVCLALIGRVAVTERES